MFMVCCAAHPIMALHAASASIVLLMVNRPCSSWITSAWPTDVAANRSQLWMHSRPGVKHGHCCARNRWTLHTEGEVGGDLHELVRPATIGRAGVDRKFPVNGRRNLGSCRYGGPRGRMARRAR